MYVGVRSAQLLTNNNRPIIMKKSQQSQPKRNGRRRNNKKFSLRAHGDSSRTAFPKEQEVVFNYFQTCNFSGAGGTPSTWVYRLNSLYDFDYTSTGHQPFQYDQMMAVYNRYRVYAVDIKIKFVNTFTTTTYPAVIVIYPSNVNSAITPYGIAAEQPFSKVVLLGGSQSGSATHDFVKSYNIANILGYRENVDEDLSAVYNTNPVQVAFLTIVVDHPNMSYGYAVSALISVRFYARVYDLISPGASIKQLLPKQYDEEADEIIEQKTKVVKFKK